ncbi:Sua5/YciO/YrdC/YwlC family protein [bacterium]|nr:Sua5/YciO/YrdC/YwlC family protein [bacterium]
MTSIKYIGGDGLEKAPAYEAAQILRDNGIIIFPADTLYGFSSAAKNFSGIRQINRIKKRPLDKPQIILLKLDWLNKYVKNFEKFLSIIDAFEPGPLTLLTEPTQDAKLSAELIEDGKIAFRISQSWFADMILDILGEPMTSSSVNFNQQNPMTKPMDIIAQFDEFVDGIFVFPEIELSGPPSTMVDVSNYPDIKLVRAGAIAYEAIEKVVEMATKQR